MFKDYRTFYKNDRPAHDEAYHLLWLLVAENPEPSCISGTIILTLNRERLKLGFVVLDM